MPVSEGSYLATISSVCRNNKNTSQLRKMMYAHLYEGSLSAYKAIRIPSRSAASQNKNSSIGYGGGDIPPAVF